MSLFSDHDSSRAPFSAVLLAGGRSTRMGRDKAGLPWPERPLWELQLAKLRALQPTELFVSARREQPIAGDDFLTVHDATADCGPLGGVSAALDAMTTPWLVVLAVDLPGMTTAFLQEMLDRAIATSCGQIPATARGLEPLAAVYPRSSAATARAQLATPDFSMRQFSSALLREKQAVSQAIRSSEAPLFRNLNRPEDLES